MTIAVLTALGRPEWDWLIEAGRSLTGLQEKNGGPGVEWIIAVDGGIATASEVSAILAGSGTVGWQIIASDSEWVGPGPRRTQALEHVTAEWVMYLDSDDRLVTDGVTAMLAAAEAAGAGWAYGRSHDIDDFGRRTSPGPGLLQGEGVLPRNALLDFVDETGHMPVMCGAILMRTALARTAGGWPALRRGQDTALACVVASLTEGIAVNDYVHEYRRHEASRTHDDTWRATPAPWDLIHQMVAAGSTRLPNGVPATV